MDGLALTRPCRSAPCAGRRALNLPRPPAPTTCAAVLGRDEVRVARERRAARAEGAEQRSRPALNVVGFSTTLTPFESFHSVMPNASFVVVVDDRARRRRRRRAAAARLTRVDVRPSSVLRRRRRHDGRQLRLGRQRQAGLLRRADERRRGCRSGDQSLRQPFTSASVISGTKRWYSSYSYAMPGNRLVAA